MTFTKCPGCAQCAGEEKPPLPLPQERKAGGGVLNAPNLSALNAQPHGLPALSSA